LSHIAGTHWIFEAGPFQILVKGTKFHAAWNPQASSFSLSMKEGSVVVSGPCLDAPRAVGVGENLDLYCLSRAAAQAPAALTATASAPAQLGTVESAAETTPAPAAPRTPRGSRGPGWRGLLAAGRPREALNAAERSDLGIVLQTANSKELLALADAARLGERVERAVEILHSLRRRFSRSPDAATASFVLGRIAFEQRRAYAESAQWFSKYLEEAPNGPVMGDAVGRLMEARGRQGDRQGARRDAEQYLRRFPEGPYASEARDILSER
jgi:TolA-binding protein